MENNFNEFEKVNEEVSEVKAKLGNSIINSIGETFKTVGEKVKDEDSPDVVVTGLLCAAIVAIGNSYFKRK